MPGIPHLELISPNGDSRVAVSAHGARVISWVHRGREMLFHPAELWHDEAASAHGGIPVLFPQFGNFGPGLKHGMVRNAVWNAVAADTHQCRFAIDQDGLADSQRLPFAFSCALSVTVQDEGIEVALAVTNTGEGAFEFTAGLHTYLLVDAIDDVTVGGLQKIPYWDALAGLRLTSPSGEQVTAPINVDRVYLDAMDPLQVRSNPRHVGVGQDGFRDVVVWNPGAEICATFEDLATDDWKRFVCIEAAQIQYPVSLPPGGLWKGSQTLTVR